MLGGYFIRPRVIIDLGMELSSGMTLGQIQNPPEFFVALGRRQTRAVPSLPVVTRYFSDKTQLRI